VHPGIDLLLNRMDCYFLPSGTGAGDDRVEAVRRLALSLTDDEALLTFPEGGNWTPKRHARAVRYLRRHRELERAAEAQAQEHVLPPRPGGVIATLSARPDLDVVVLAHAGLDLLVSPLDMWDAIPLDHQPMAIRWWVAPATTVPREEDEILGWVDDVWADVDGWVEAEVGASRTAPWWRFRLSCLSSRLPCCPRRWPSLHPRRPRRTVCRPPRRRSLSARPRPPRRSAQRRAFSAFGCRRGEPSAGTSSTPSMTHAPVPRGLTERLLHHGGRSCRTVGAPVLAGGRQTPACSTA